MHDDGMSAERPRAGVMFINVAAGSSSRALRRKLNQDESKSSDQKRVKLLQNDLFTPVHLVRLMASALSAEYGPSKSSVSRGVATLTIR